MLTSSAPSRHHPFLVVSSLCLLASLILCFPSSLAAPGDGTPDTEATIIWRKGGSSSNFPLSAPPDLAAGNNMNDNAVSENDWKIMDQRAGAATSVFPTMRHRFLLPSCLEATDANEKKYEKKSKMLAKFIQKQIHPRPTIDSVEIDYVEENDRRRRRSLRLCGPRRLPITCRANFKSVKPFTPKQVRAVVKKIKVILRTDAYKSVFSKVTKTKISGNKKWLYVVIKFQPMELFE